MSDNELWIGTPGALNMACMDPYGCTQGGIDYIHELKKNIR